MKSWSPLEAPTLHKTCVSSKKLCNKIHSHKLEKHELVAHIIHEEISEGNENMSEILLQKESDGKI